MMHRQGHRLSSSGSISSQTSNATSRVTTLSEARSDADRRHQQGNDQYSVQSTDSDSTNTVIYIEPQAFKTDLNPGNEKTPQNQSQQQQSWINPSGGAKSTSNASATQSQTNNRSDSNERAGSATGVHQLIHGSILINDRGEIGDLLCKKNTIGNSIATNNPLNPYSQQASEANRGYLASTQGQGRIATSSGVNVHPGDLSDHRRPESTWINSGNSRMEQSPTVTYSRPSSWINSYDSTNLPEPSTSVPVNQNANLPIPNGVRHSEQSSTFDIRFLPTPSFYERLYPPNTISTSPETNTNSKPNTTLAHGTIRQNVDGYNSLYAFHHQGTTQNHESSFSTNTANQVVTSNPLLPGIQNVAPTANITIPQHTPFNHNNTATSSSSTPLSPIVLTKLDLDTIQDAFRLLATNPDGIPTIESTQQISPFLTGQPRNPSSLVPSLPISNREQQLAPFNPPSYVSNLYSPQISAFSTGNYPLNYNALTQPLAKERSIVLI